ncbi:MAG: DUF3089 domain-containing protein [Ruminiclostridium sp.]
MKNKIHSTFIIAALILLPLILTSCSKKADSKYADPANWAYYNDGEDKSADVFFVCPTVDMGEDGNYNMSLDNEKVKANFVGATNMEKGIFDENAAVYAPYYRQVSFPIYSMSDEDAAQYFDIAYSDVREAFLYYTENCDPDRPIILFGFSQGADMVKRLLTEFFDEGKYSDRLVAAYCIGWYITDDEIAASPWLKPAKSADDTGVIVCFNSESEDINASLTVPEGVSSICINPLSWTTSGEYADASLNLGACFTDYSGAIVREENNYTGCYIDAERGTLKLPDIVPSEYSNGLFPDGVYHLYDYQFFYRNLQQNVKTRLEAFENK